MSYTPKIFYRMTIKGRSENLGRNALFETAFWAMVFSLFQMFAGNFLFPIILGATQLIELFLGLFPFIPHINVVSVAYDFRINSRMTNFKDAFLWWFLVGAFLFPIITAIECAIFGLKEDVK